jgi:hypothetical protein
VNGRDLTAGGGHGRGGAARSRGGNSPEMSRPATVRHQRLGGWPRHAQGGSGGLSREHHAGAGAPEGAAHSEAG